MDRWEVEKRIVLKALKDPQFKEKLKETPQEALRQFLDEETDIPAESIEHLRVKVKEENETEFIIAIPHSENVADDMSKEELRHMAAGGCFLATMQTAWYGPCH